MNFKQTSRRELAAIFASSCLLEYHQRTFIHELTVMRVSPILLLIVLVFFVLTPSIQDWITQGGTAWYRPYIVWLGVIGVAYWSQRSNSSNEL